MKTMTSTERFHALMNFQPVDRLPLVEWAMWWDNTIARWYGEGLSPAVTDRYDLYRHFGLEIYHQTWIGEYAPDTPWPAHGQPFVRTMQEYEAFLPHLYPWPRIDAAYWQDLAVRQKHGDTVVWFTMGGPFWFPRQLLGIEPHMFAFYDQPDLMLRINDNLLDWHLRTLKEMFRHCKPDFMTFAEDMSYNNGPMLSEELFDTFMLPYYRRVVPELKRRGIRVLIDTDGDLTQALPWFERAGIEGILPLERQAGVNLAAIRERYPTMLFIGHYDKRVMAKGEAAMRTEFERLLPTMRTGGFIPSVDHQTPPGVSLENYWIYVRLLREYAGRG
jgi:uroporphyrinogen-III decarboxylase